MELPAAIELPQLELINVFAEQPEGSFLHQLGGSVLGSSLGKERKGVGSSLSSSFVPPIGVKSFGCLNDSVTDVPRYRPLGSMDETGPLGFH